MFEQNVDAHPALAFARLLNALGHLVSPAAWEEAVAKVGESDLRAGVLDALDAAGGPLVAMGLLPDDGIDLEAVLAPVRERVIGWARGAPPDEVRAASAEALTALGVPEPARGWARFRPDTM